MSTQHTPGPWMLADHGYTKIVSKPGDGYITRDVCRMDASTSAAFEQHANARLIAAAPDLLAALIRCEQMVSTDAGSPDWNWVRAAIAKATPG